MYNLYYGPDYNITSGPWLERLAHLLVTMSHTQQFNVTISILVTIEKEKKRKIWLLLL